MRVKGEASRTGKVGAFRVASCRCGCWVPGTRDWSKMSFIDNANQYGNQAARPGEGEGRHWGGRGGGAPR